MACPNDIRVLAGTVCRPAAGPCDVAEQCDGVSVACATDKKQASGFVCSKGSLASCTVDSVCDGTNVTCPANGPAAAGTVCSTGSPASCTVDAMCDGTTAPCPANGPAIAGTVCRPVAGTCDEPETCDGHTTTCPPDMFKQQGTVCEAARSTCEKDANCMGTAAACPEHTIIPNGTPCDAHSLCVAAGSTCLAAACIGGTRIVGFDSTDVSVAPGKDATVVVRHTANGDPIELTGAITDPAASFAVSGPSSWPIQLASGETVSLTVKLAATHVGTYQGTLTVKATGCNDSDLQIPVEGQVDGKVSRLPGCGEPGGPASLMALALFGLLRRRRR